MPSPGPRIFISFQSIEGAREAVALRQRLQAHGIDHVALSPATRNDARVADLTQDHIRNADLIVVLGTKLYGKRTAELFSMHDELSFIIKEQKRVLLIHMCHNFKYISTQNLLTRSQHHSGIWFPQYQYATLRACASMTALSSSTTSVSAFSSSSSVSTLTLWKPEPPEAVICSILHLVSGASSRVHDVAVHVSRTRSGEQSPAPSTPHRHSQAATHGHECEVGSATASSQLTRYSESMGYWNPGATLTPTTARATARASTRRRLPKYSDSSSRSSCDDISSKERGTGGGDTGVCDGRGGVKNTVDEAGVNGGDGDDSTGSQGEGLRAAQQCLRSILCDPPAVYAKRAEALTTALTGIVACMIESPSTIVNALAADVHATNTIIDAAHMHAGDYEAQRLVCCIIERVVRRHTSQSRQRAHTRTTKAPTVAVGDVSNNNSSITNSVSDNNDNSNNTNSEDAAGSDPGNGWVEVRQVLLRKVPALMLMVMWHHQGDECIQTCGCGVLNMLVRDADGDRDDDNDDSSCDGSIVLNHMVAKGGYAAIITAMHTHSSVPAIQRAGCKVLAKLMRRCASTVSSVVDLGGVEVMTEALQQHKDNASIARAACHCISTLLKRILGCIRGKSTSTTSDSSSGGAVGAGKTAAAARTTAIVCDWSGDVASAAIATALHHQRSRSVHVASLSVFTTLVPIMQQQQQQRQDWQCVRTTAAKLATEAIHRFRDDAPILNLARTLLASLK
ncbi:hypothetical protein PTSG_03536 [Salpingoeca rosetta]|uniref:Uncharacterized protein n=1 Tax=Salpingoeca rosetta (strain ATCC 50818 / BSB-021) TaxID=946362 RepID=F2U5W3_SALR5|nr:uncharacterized protein PTSG_03536 [Salpingoeca rosetta]EGD82904.1 hypothetical protein PTSG_03536 [Salpingoeca rosetta]|eukprot:XP_004995268.1 hypothetical protein PTSG_03536 [Salpingoeca rosetta]